MKQKGITAALLSAVLFGQSAAYAYDDLPQIGTAALSTLSLQKEETLGKLYTFQLRSQAPLLNDPLITEYIESLGHRLVAHARGVNYPFDFMVIKSDELNAFAYFGGHVAVFSDIILEADNEDELASVMAHEIAHVTQRHLARKMEHQQQNLPLTIAGIAASILIGLANPEAGMAGLQASVAASQQFSINYTRQNEQEADRVGFQTLYAAGFRPIAMANFFEKLVEKYRFVRKPPAFLLDHPLSENRVAEARNRALQYPQVHHQSSLDFYLTQMLIRAQYGDNPKRVQELLEHQQQEGKVHSEQVLQYGLGLTALQLNNNQKALDIANQLLKKHPHNLYYQVLKSDSLVALNKAAAAAKFLQPSADIMPNSPIVTLNQAHAWIEAKEGQKAIDLLEPYLYVHAGDPLAIDLMIQAQNLVKNTAAREYWQAEKMAYYGAFDRAINHFNKAYSLYGNNNLEQRRIEGRIAQLQQQKSRFEALR
ncbi:M48 family metalloprotease [Gallaecimonas sp. GXIMD1310]|uniref:beta-barrel assembly-enhancing protease n=1 Tax=Gallaecimonas sp. GXIMD1310 TaxID=3131926 RepID=UPI00324DD15B